MHSMPNIYKGCSLDPDTLQKLSEPCFSLDQPSSLSHSLGGIPFHLNNNNNGTSTMPSSNGGDVDDGGVGLQLQQQQQRHSLLSSSPHSSTSHLSVHGSNPQLNSLHGSNSSLSGAMGSEALNHMGDSGGGGFYATPKDTTKLIDRSQSLGNIYNSIQSQPLGQFYHHNQQQRQPQQQPQQQPRSAGPGPMAVMSNLHVLPSSVEGSSTCNPSSPLLPLPSATTAAAPSQCLPVFQRRGSGSPLQSYQKRKQEMHGEEVSKALVKRSRYMGVRKFLDQNC